MHRVSGHHHHGHSHAPADASARRLKIALALLVGLMAVEVVAGILAQSLALLSDAAHMLTDAGAIVLALVAIRLARRPAKGAMTYGLGRSEILSAQFNGATLLDPRPADRLRGRAPAVRPAAGRGRRRARGGAARRRGQHRRHRRAARRRPPLAERRGRVPARADRPRRVHRDGDRGLGDPARPGSTVRTGSRRCSWPP